MDPLQPQTSVKDLRKQFENQEFSFSSSTSSSPLKQDPQAKEAEAQSLPKPLLGRNITPQQTRRPLPMPGGQVGKGLVRGELPLAKQNSPTAPPRPIKGASIQQMQRPLPSPGGQASGRVLRGQLPPAKQSSPKMPPRPIRNASHQQRQGPLPVPPNQVDRSMKISSPSIRQGMSQKAMPKSFSSPNAWKPSLPSLNNNVIAAGTPDVHPVSSPRFLDHCSALKSAGLADVLETVRPIEGLIDMQFEGKVIQAKDPLFSPIYRLIEQLQSQIDTHAGSPAIHAMISYYRQRITEICRQSCQSTQDLEGRYYLELEEAHDCGDMAKQVSSLEKMADLASHKAQYEQSAHLLNAALALETNNQKRRQQLFRKLAELERAFVKELTGKNVSEVNGESIERFRDRLSEIRRRTCLAVEGKKDIFEIQAQLTSDYQALLTSLIHNTMQWIGKQESVNYTAFALGSMARGEMCPYSDVEFGILIEKESLEVLNYFRSLSRILYFRMINLGETKLNLLRPKRLNDGSMREAVSLVPGGFSMDIGGLSPLGKTGVYELIGTPQRLANYQGPEWLEKHDGEVILVNALTQTTYITGDAQLIKQYYDAVASHLNKRTKRGSYLNVKVSSELRKTRALELLSGHLEQFKPYLSEDRISLRAFNVKQDFYRPLQMAVATLLLYNNWERGGAYQGIQTLRKKKWLSAKGAEQLIRALRTALELRMRAHFFYAKEKEFLYLPKGEDDKQQEGLMVAGPEESKSIREIYRTLIPLHHTMEAFAKNPGQNFQKVNFYDEAVGDATKVRGQTSKFKVTERSGVKYIQPKTEKEKEKERDYGAAEASVAQTLALDPDNSAALANYFDLKNELGQAIETLNTAESLLQLTIKKCAENSMEIAHAHQQLASAYWELRQFDQALEQAQKTLVIMDKQDVSLEEKANVRTLMGLLMQGKGDLETALVYQREAFTILHPTVDRRKRKRPLPGISLNRRIVENWEEEPSWILASIYNNLGATYHDLGEYQQAAAYYEEALATHKRSLKSGDSNTILIISRVLLNIGQTYQRAGQPNRALHYYQESLNINFNRYKGHSHPEIADCLSQVGAAWTDLGDPDKGLEYLEKALKMKKDQLEDTCNSDTILMSVKVALAWQKKGEAAKALRLLKRALEMRDTIYGTAAHKDRAEILYRLGSCFHDIDQFDEAVARLEEAKAIFQKTLGVRPYPDHAMTLELLGSCYHQLGRKEEALAETEAAYRMALQVYGRVAASTLDCRKRLIEMGATPTKSWEEGIPPFQPVGSFCSNEMEEVARLDDATLEEVNEEYHIELRHYDSPRHIAFYEALLGDQYLVRQDKEKINHYLNTALDSYERIYCEGANLEEVRLLKKIGNFYYSVNFIDGAIKSYCRAILRLQNVHGKIPHADVAYFSNEVGKLYFQQKNYKQALVFFNTALNTLHQCYGDQAYPKIAEVYFNIGSAYDERNKFKEVVQNYAKGLAIMELIHSDQPAAEIAIRYNNMARAYHMLKDRKSAIKNYTKALEINKRHYGNSHDEVALCLRSLGYAYLEEKEYQKAGDHFMEAYKACLFEHGPYDRQTLDAEKNLKRVGIKVKKVEGEEGISIQFASKK